MKRRHLGLIIGALAALSLALAGFAGASSQAKPRPTAQVLFGADQEPNSVNPITEDHLWAAVMNGMVFVGSHILTPQFVYQNYMINKLTVQKKPERLTYYIKKNAVWYENGKTRPVTADDFIFTWKLITDKRVPSISVVGYEDIKSAKKINAKTVRFTFKKNFAGTLTLFNQILPKYALSGTESKFNEVLKTDLNNPKTGKPISNGPYLLQNWKRGQNATFVQNPKFSLTHKAYVKKFIMKFLTDTQTAANQIRGGEVDIIETQPQTFLVPLRRVKSLRVQTGLGPVWEHIDINMGYGKGDPQLKKRFVREAIIRGIDRQGIVNTLYHKTGIAPALKVLNAVLLVNNQKGYTPYFKTYGHSAAKSQALLKKNGCTKGGDGIFSCGGQKLSFRLSTTASNQNRVLAEQIIQQNLKQAGIDINIVNDPGRLLFDKRLPAGDFDLAMYAWQGSPDLSGNDNIYGCRNEKTNHALQNRQGYCNRKVDALLSKVNQTFGVADQTKLTNQAIKLMAKDINNVPLFQKPTFMVHKRILAGAKENATLAGPLWNVEQWYKTAS